MEIKKVSTIKGHYDEESKSVIQSINNRKFCFSHKWINASLRWDKNNYSISIENEQKKWGFGYGGIRYCEKCKKIDCIHLWDEEKTIEYRIGNNDFSYQSYIVKTCRICKRKIYTHGCTHNRPSEKAMELLNKYIPKYTSNNFGSWWFCELPVEISLMLEKEKEKDVIDFIKALTTGNFSTVNIRHDFLTHVSKK